MTTGSRRDRERLSTDPAVQWDPSRRIYPRHLKLYTECPYRVRLRYLDDVPEPKTFNLAFAKGQIAHQLLQYCAHQLQRGHPPPDAQTLLTKVQTRFRRDDFPSDLTWQKEIDALLQAILFGLRYLAPDETFLKIEKNGTREFIADSEIGPFTLATRADLVLLRENEDGPYVEIVDYKTGRRWQDMRVPVISRFVFRDLLQEHFPDPSTARVVFTYLWLGSKEVESIELDPGLCYDHWIEIRQTMRNLLAETEWPAQPSSRCQYCPYAQKICQHAYTATHDPQPF